MRSGGAVRMSRGVTANVRLLREIVPLCPNPYVDKKTGQDTRQGWNGMRRVRSDDRDWDQPGVARWFSVHRAAARRGSETRLLIEG